jgi:pyruvate kinase
MRCVREVVAETRGVCAILLDTKGPEIRTCKLKDGKDVMLKKGQTFTLVNDPNFVGDVNKVEPRSCPRLSYALLRQVGVTYGNISKVLKVGNHVLIDDGLISMTVTDVKEGVITCLVNNNGEVRLPTPLCPKCRFSWASARA